MLRYSVMQFMLIVVQYNAVHCGKVPCVDVGGLRYSVLAMSKLWYFPNSSFRFLAFVNKKNETSLFFRIFFGSINIEAVRFIFESKTAKLKIIVSLC